MSRFVTVEWHLSCQMWSEMVRGVIFRDKKSYKRGVKKGYKREICYLNREECVT